MAYMDMIPPTDSDMESYPHVIFTSDDTWDPSTMDDEFAPDTINVTEDDLTPDYGRNRVNDYGELL